MVRLTVLQAPAPVLNQIAQPVTFQEPRLLELLLDMVGTLRQHRDPPGVGLAAPQVGVSLRIFIALLQGKEYRVFINPEIIDMQGDSTTTKEGQRTAEGCLSLKAYYGYVKRATEVTVKYQTIEMGKLLNSELSPSTSLRIKTQNPELKTSTFHDFDARIIQHELDHLNGMLFTARVIQQQAKIYREFIENGQPVWEEVEIG